MRKYLFIVLSILQGVLSLSGQTTQLTIEEVFNITRRINGFQEIEYIEDDIKFPSNIGNPHMIIHGNADPRAAILDLLYRLPMNSLVYDDTDERGKFDRMYLDEKKSYLLYVHVGIGGNDTYLVLFKGGKIEDINRFLSSINNSH